MPPTIPEPAIPELIAALGPIFGRGVVVEVRKEGRLSGGGGRAAATLAASVAWGSERWEFAAEAKIRSTPRVLEEAIAQSRRRASRLGYLPMVIVPFLGARRLEQLEEQGVSGLDLCGNGFIVVPSRLLLRRTGEPNRYPDSQPTRFAYRGATSLVPRVFLRRGGYSSVGQVRDEIAAAGGKVAMSTVSKALARMAEDLIVDRSQGGISLVQPERLLAELVEQFTPPKPERVVQLKAGLSLEELFRRIETTGDTAPDFRAALSGASCQDRYSGGLRADVPVVYTDDLDALKARMGAAWTPTDRFATLQVIETRDPTPFFDVRVDERGVRNASVVQTYLELATSGDKRDMEMAQEVRARILRPTVT